MGLGHFGGGLGVTRWLLDAGARVTLTDLKSREELADSLQQLDVGRLENLVLGEHRDEDFTQAELVVVNPAVRRTGNRYLAAAEQAGVPLTSEMQLFWERCPARKLVVTGSAGKSTTASLIAAGLEAAGVPSRLGGNIGISLLSELSEITPAEWIVLELSSFQLAALAPLQPRPDVTVVTNFFPNHLDWHGDLDEYRAAKEVSVGWQTSDQVAILNADDPDVALWITDAHVVWFGNNCWKDRPGVVIQDQELMVRSPVGGWRLTTDDLALCLRPPHQLSNVAAALAALSVAQEIPVDVLAPVLRDFRGLPHRLEAVGNFQGCEVIDDSKATTPEASIAALNSVAQPLLLIAGGRDKGADLSAFAARIVETVKAVALLGETGPVLQQLILTAAAGRSSVPAVHLASSMADAAAWLQQQGAAGDTILLSPGCASDAEFLNFEQRGRRFREEFGLAAEES